MGTVVLTCRGNTVVSYTEADELVIYDMEARRVVSRLRKPDNPVLLEDMLEDLDAWAILSEGVPPSVSDVIRDMGIKVQLVARRNIKDLIDELFV